MDPLAKQYRTEIFLFVIYFMSKQLALSRNSTSLERKKGKKGRDGIKELSKYGISTVPGIVLPHSEH
jgi:hypothetical protein